MKQRNEKSKIAFTTGKETGLSCPTCLSGVEPTTLEPPYANVVRES